MIAVGAILADELIDLFAAILISQIPAILSYAIENEDKVKEDIQKFLARLSGW